MADPLASDVSLHLGPVPASASEPTAETRAQPQPGERRDSTDNEIDQGLASWYGSRFHGRPTASGEPFDMHALTAAHPTLPFGTVVRVRSVEDGRTVDVRINDRGPWIKRRVIDLSRAAAEALGVIASGTRRVVLSVLPARERKEKGERQRRTADTNLAVPCNFACDK